MLLPFQDELLIVNPRRRGALILCKNYHAELAGPGAAVGIVFDQDCQQVIPIGSLSLIQAESADERTKAYLLRRQWVQLVRQITNNAEPLQRAGKLLEQLEGFFDRETIAEVPDEILALLIGVLPQTVKQARQKRNGDE